MSVYLIGNIWIEDRAEYQQYEAGFLEIFQRYAGKLLAVDEDQTVLEGQWPATRTVVIEFPDEAAARAWYESEAYQTLAKHRWASSQGDLALVKGFGAG